MSGKTKIYVDTSVWNFVFEDDRLDCFITKKFFEGILSHSKHEILISEIVTSEMDKANDIRKQNLLKLVRKMKPSIINLDNESVKLARIYVEENVVPKKSFDHAVHMAIATVNRCSFIVSWNFKHMVRAKTIRGVHLTNHREGYGLIDIVTPREFLGK